MEITIEHIYGGDIAGYVETLANLRISTFREYPYLYEGNVTYEKSYLKGYTENEKSTLLLAKVNGELAGVLTGLPLASQSDIVKDAQFIFESNGLISKDYYYLGEVIILPQYRRVAVIRKLFLAQLAQIKKWRYRSLCALVVERTDNHWLKPLDYKEPDKLWARAGFKKTNLSLTYHWPTFMPDNSIKDSEHRLRFMVFDLPIS